MYPKNTDILAAVLNNCCTDLTALEFQSSDLEPRRGRGPPKTDSKASRHVSAHGRKVGGFQQMGWSALETATVLHVGPAALRLESSIEARRNADTSPGLYTRGSLRTVPWIQIDLSSRKWICMVQLASARKCLTCLQRMLRKCLVASSAWETSSSAGSSPRPKSRSTATEVQLPRGA